METVNVNQNQLPEELKEAVNLQFLDLLVKYRLKAVLRKPHPKLEHYPRFWDIYTEEGQFLTTFREGPEPDSFVYGFLKSKISRYYGRKIRKIAEKNGFYTISKRVSDGKGGRERRWWFVKLLSDEAGISDFDLLARLETRRRITCKKPTIISTTSTTGRSTGSSRPDPAAEFFSVGFFSSQLGSSQISIRS